MCTAGGHLLQQIFSYFAIIQIWVKISFWKFHQLIITWLCQIDKKFLVPTQSACQPRPISAKTLNVSSDHMCWDILKRKKLGGFQTISNDWLEGIFDILKKRRFEIFWSSCESILTLSTYNLSQNQVCNFLKKFGLYAARFQNLC